MTFSLLRLIVYRCYCSGHENDDPDLLAQQISPQAYGNVIPYSVGAGTNYEIDVTITNTTSGPKYFAEVIYECPQVTFLMPGHTLILDVSDPSNFNYTPAFSTTPDGTHNGGTEYNVGVTRVGTPGTSGAQISLTYTQTTPKQIYIYAQETPKVGVRGSEFIAPTVHFRATMFCKWYLARISQQTNGLDYGLYSYTEDGDGVDLYVIDAGVRGASRPVNATGANLHPELYHPDHIADLNGATEQANYRVYEVPGFNSGYTVNGEADSNEDDNGHGTNCAICATGLQHGVSRKTRIYALKTQGSNGSGLLSSYVNAILAIINHNDPNHPNWKGNNRPAVINASVGVNILPRTISLFLRTNLDLTVVPMRQTLQWTITRSQQMMLVLCSFVPLVTVSVTTFSMVVTRLSSTLVLVLLVLRTISTIWKVFVTRSLWVQPR